MKWFSMKQEMCFVYYRLKQFLTLFRPQKRLTFSPSMFLQLLGFTFPNKAEI